MDPSALQVIAAVSVAVAGWFAARWLVRIEEHQKEDRAQLRQLAARMGKLERAKEEERCPEKT